LSRQLARDNPAHQDDLAVGLNNLGNQLMRLGRYQAALAAAEESVGLCRQVARDNPARQDDLASALNNLGNQLTKLGRYHGGACRFSQCRRRLGAGTYEGWPKSRCPAATPPGLC
jgi:hypothetical protein